MFAGLKLYLGEYVDTHGVFLYTIYKNIIKYLYKFRTKITAEVKVINLKKAVVNQKECVACGVCAKTCPRQAITVVHGIYAVVDEKLCIGCRKCEKACPASVITVMEKEAAS